jgi:hypothetical protein
MTLWRDEHNPTLRELKLILFQLRPLLESRLALMAQENERGLLHRLSYALARQRHRDLCKVLDESLSLETALTLCAPLAQDVDALLEADPQHQGRAQQFYDLYFAQGYTKLAGMLQRKN